MYKMTKHNQVVYCESLLVCKTSVRPLRVGLLPYFHVYQSISVQVYYHIYWYFKVVLDGVNPFPPDTILGDFLK